MKRFLRNNSKSSQSVSTGQYVGVRGPLQGKNFFAGGFAGGILLQELVDPLKFIRVRAVDRSHVHVDRVFWKLGLTEGLFVTEEQRNPFLFENGGIDLRQQSAR